MLKAIVNSAKKAWRGEENLWKVFWLWGVLLYILDFIVPLSVGSLSGYLYKIDYIKYNDFILIIIMAISKIIGAIGLLLIIIHPIFWIKSLWTCRKSTSSKIFGYIPLILLPLILWAHAQWSFVLFIFNFGLVSVHK